MTTITATHTITHTMRTTMTETEIRALIAQMEATLAATRSALDEMPDNDDLPEVKAAYAQIFWCEDQIRAATHALPARTSTNLAAAELAWARELERRRREDCDVASIKRADRAADVAFARAGRRIR
jgi:hypothetical protein